LNGGTPSQGPCADALRTGFSGGGLHGWAATEGTLDPSGGAATLRVRGPASALLGPDGLGLDASSINRIEVDLRIVPPEAGATLYWTDDAEGGFVSDWCAPLVSGRQVLDMRGRSGWSGTIDRFLLAPGRGARSVSLLLFEARGARGPAERAGDSWRGFWSTELRAQYSVNGMVGPTVGPVPFALLLGVLFVALPLLAALRRPRAFRATAARTLPRWLLAGTVLFLARAAWDEARIGADDASVLGGRSLDEKIAAVNPPGFYALLSEASKSIPAGAPVELRAARPYPWERGGYYLYPSRVVDGAEYVVSYRTSAPSDSASGALLLRVEGVGSVYRRGAP
jgi:hypothetical protein